MVISGWRRDFAPERAGVDIVARPHVQPALAVAAKVQMRVASPTRLEMGPDGKGGVPSGCRTGPHENRTACFVAGLVERLIDWRGQREQLVLAFKHPVHRRSFR